MKTLQPIDLQLGDYPISLVSNEDAFFILLRPLSEILSIDYWIALGEIKLHAKTVELCATHIHGSTQSEYMFRLEYLSWFLLHPKWRRNFAINWLSVHAPYALMDFCFEGRGTVFKEQTPGRIKIQMPFNRHREVLRPEFSLETWHEIERLLGTGLSQAQVARRVGFSPATINQCVKGVYPTLAKLLKQPPT